MLFVALPAAPPRLAVPPATGPCAAPIPSSSCRLVAPAFLARPRLSACDSAVLSPVPDCSPDLPSTSRLKYVRCRTHIPLRPQPTMPESAESTCRRSSRRLSVRPHRPYTSSYRKQPLNAGITNCLAAKPQCQLPRKMQSEGSEPHHERSFGAIRQTPASFPPEEQEPSR